MKKGKAGKGRSRKSCKVCGKPEQKSVGGMYTNLSPYSQTCIDCMNAAMGVVDKGKGRR